MEMKLLYSKGLLVLAGTWIGNKLNLFILIISLLVF